MTPADSVQLGKSLPSHAPPTYHAPFFLDVFFFYTRGFDSPPGVSGFGRIGRLVVRSAFETEGACIAAINDPHCDVEYAAYLFKVTPYSSNPLQPPHDPPPPPSATLPFYT